MTRRLVLVFVMVIGIVGVVVTTHAQSEDCQVGVDYLAQAQGQIDAAAYADALASYTCALESDPEDALVRIGRLHSALLARDYLTAYGDVFLLTDGSTRAVADVIAAQPEDVSGLQLRAFLLAFSGAPDAALADATAVLSVEPDNVLALLIQSASLEMVGDVDGAANAFASAESLSPDNPQIYGLMAAMQFVAFNVEGMAVNSSRAIELDPELAHPYRLHGFSQMFMGDPAAAKADANRAIERDPTYYAFYILRASTSLASGDPQAAMADLDKAIDLNPRTAIGHGIRANVLFAIGDEAAAGQGFATAIELGTEETVEGAVLIAGEPVIVPMTAGRTYRLPFDGQAGRRVTISVTSVNPGEVDPLLLVAGPDGAPLAFNDDVSDENFDALVSDYELPSEGTYTLVVSHANFGSEGDIEISLEVQ